MKATIVFEVTVDVEVPDDLPERIRQLAREDGENHVAVDASDQDIMERIAVIRGLRGFSHDEAMTFDMDELVSVVISYEKT